MEGGAVNVAGRRLDHGPLLRGAVIGLAVVVGLVAWLATKGDEEGAPAPPEAGPRIVSAAELADTAAKLGQPVYWAGELPGTELALSELPEGGVQVRYLPEGTDPAEAPAEALTIGSYPLADPAAAIEELAQRPGAVVRHARDGREVVSSEARPTSAYFASPGGGVQVEVYNPSPKRAMGLALSGRLEAAR